MSDPAHDKSRHVEVDLSEARVTRLWRHVAERLEPPRRGARWLWVGASASALLLLAFVITRNLQRQSDSPRSAWDGARLETAADTLAVTLVDGSKLKLEPNSRVEVGDGTASAAKLVLERGRIECDVIHRPGRTFVVWASGVEVHVVGTRFTVATEHGADAIRVEVRVERGAVEVRSAGRSEDVTRVEAGRSWSRITKTAELAAQRGDAAMGTARAAVAHDPPPPAPASAQPAVDPAVPVAGAPGVAAEASASRVGRASDARELLEQASGLFREGRVAEAARTYQALLSTYPGDPRAGLAAFELGRLRMDRLGDPTGAVRALERAVALAPGSSFREDALARLTAAYTAVGDSSGCQRSRDRYLREFPSGVRRRTVAAACAAR